MVVGFCSCESDPIIYDVENGQTLIQFGDSSGTLLVSKNGGSIDIPVTVTTVSDSDRAVQVSVDTSSTADPSEYVIGNALVPAGSYTGTITVSGNFDAIPELKTTKLVLNLDGVEGGDVVENGKFTLGLSKQCDSDLAGTYSVLTNGQSTDPAAPDPVVDLPATVTLTSTGDNTYKVSDIFAGIYIDWYCAAYDECEKTEQSISDVCGKISGSFTEPFGESASVTGKVNDDGTLTISFTTGFGDMATSVYTKM